MGGFEGFERCSDLTRGGGGKVGLWGLTQKQEISVNRSLDGNGYTKRCR